MSAQFSRKRRFALAATALAISVVLFRPILAQALVVRGDDYLYASNVPAAMEHYGRALLFDGRSEEAADRYIFAAILAHRRRTLDDGIAVADTFLSGNPGSVPVLEDRALCRLRLKDYRGAYRDFAYLAGRADPARNFAFAGWAAWYSGRRVLAKQMWRRSLQRDPAFLPARAALRRASRA